MKLLQIVIVGHPLGHVQIKTLIPIPIVILVHYANRDKEYTDAEIPYNLPRSIQKHYSNAARDLMGIQQQFQLRIKIHNIQWPIVIRVLYANRNKE